MAEGHSVTVRWFAAYVIATLLLMGVSFWRQEQSREHDREQTEILCEAAHENRDALRALAKTTLGPLPVDEANISEDLRRLRLEANPGRAVRLQEFNQQYPSVTCE